jgi:hypothetical protein
LQISVKYITDCVIGNTNIALEYFNQQKNLKCKENILTKTVKYFTMPSIILE